MARTRWPSNWEGYDHWRNQCDYDDEVENLGLVVGAAVATAREVVNRL